MLPFDLPAVSRGFAEHSAEVALIGSAAAERVATAVGKLLACEVRVFGRAVPGCPMEGGGCARLFFDLPALPGTAVFEIDAALVASAVDRLAGGTGEVPGATALTPIETSVLELVALASLEALYDVEAVKNRLSPRLGQSCEPPKSPLCVELELMIGDRVGRARLLLPPAAVRAFRRGNSDLPEAIAEAQLSCSVRQGSAVLTAEELSALREGDVVLLDPDPADLLVLAGGCRINGRLGAERFQVEEIS
jgi:type III secretion protein Q